MALAEHWNGVKWTIQRTPNPAGATQSELFGVSYLSAHACTAVGYYEGSTFEPLAEHWNGTRWAIEPLPNPSGSENAQLLGVSCLPTRPAPRLDGGPTVLAAEP